MGFVASGLAFGHDQRRFDFEGGRYGARRPNSRRDSFADFEARETFGDMPRSRRFHERFDQETRQQFNDCDRQGHCNGKRESASDRQRFFDDDINSCRSAKNSGKDDDSVKNSDREPTSKERKFAHFEDARQFEKLRRRQQLEDCDRFGDCQRQRRSTDDRRPSDFKDSNRSDQNNKGEKEFDEESTCEKSGHRPNRWSRESTDRRGYGFGDFERQKHFEQWAKRRSYQDQYDDRFDHDEVNQYPYRFGSFRRNGDFEREALRRGFYDQF